MAEAGADVLVPHMGLTTCGHDRRARPRSRSTRPSSGCRRCTTRPRRSTRTCSSSATAARSPSPRTPPTCWSAPRGVVGFFGASSMERLPTETAMTENMRRFKAIPTSSRKERPSAGALIQPRRPARHLRLGLDQMVRAARRDRGSRLTFGEVILQPGNGHDRHNHPESEEIIFVQAGERADGRRRGAFAARRATRSSSPRGCFPLDLGTRVETARCSRSAPRRRERSRGSRTSPRTSREVAPGERLTGAGPTRARARDASETSPASCATRSEPGRWSRRSPPRRLHGRHVLEGARRPRKRDPAGPARPRRARPAPRTTWSRSSRPANRHRVPVVPWGGGSGSQGGAVPDRGRDRSRPERPRPDRGGGRGVAHRDRRGGRERPAARAGAERARADAPPLPGLGRPGDGGRLCRGARVGRPLDPLREDRGPRPLAPRCDADGRGHRHAPGSAARCGPRADAAFRRLGGHARRDHPRDAAARAASRRTALRGGRFDVGPRAASPRFATRSRRGLRPSVVRLYDEAATRQTLGPVVGEELDGVCAVLCFEGEPAVVDAEAERVLALARAHGARGARRPARRGAGGRAATSSTSPPTIRRCPRSGARSRPSRPTPASRASTDGGARGDAPVRARRAHAQGRTSATGTRGGR